MKKVGTVKIEMVINICEYEMDEGVCMYSWVTSWGEDSPELFYSIEEAMYDAEVTFS